MSSLSCPGCGTPYGADDLSLATGLARCRRCDRVHQIAAAPARRIQPVMPRPGNVTEIPDGLSWRWFTPIAIFFVFFCTFWDGFLIFWYAGFLSGTADLEDAAVLPFLLFPLIHVAVGIGLSYYTLALFLNRTTLTLRDGALVIRHQPLPWPGARSVPTTTLSQLYVARRVNRTKNGTTTSYDLMALDTQNIAERLLRGLPSLEHARYLEQWLEDALHIQNRPVNGEAD